MAGLHFSVLSHQLSWFWTTASQFGPFSSRLIKAWLRIRLLLSRHSLPGCSSGLLVTVCLFLWRFPIIPPMTPCWSQTLLCFAALISLWLPCSSTPAGCFLWTSAATFKSLPTVLVRLPCCNRVSNTPVSHSHTWIDKGQLLIFGHFMLPGYWSWH